MLLLITIGIGRGWLIDFLFLQKTPISRQQNTLLTFSRKPPFFQPLSQSFPFPLLPPFSPFPSLPKIPKKLKYKSRQFRLQISSTSSFQQQLQQLSCITVHISFSSPVLFPSSSYSNSTRRPKYYDILSNLPNLPLSRLWHSSMTLSTSLYCFSILWWCSLHCAQFLLPMYFSIKLQILSFRCSQGSRCIKSNSSLRKVTYDYRSALLHLFLLSIILLLIQILLKVTSLLSVALLQNNDSSSESSKGEEHWSFTVTAQLISLGFFVNLDYNFILCNAHQIANRSPCQLSSSLGLAKALAFAGHSDRSMLSSSF